MQVKFELIKENARLPERGHDIDVGLDVYTPAAGILRPGVNTIPLGITCHVPVGYGAFLYPRTGMASGKAVWDMEVVASSLGGKTLVSDVTSDAVSIIAHMPPIDPGYTGEINAIVTNNSNLHIRYPLHTRFGQLVFYPIAYAVPTLAVDTSRGTGAFNSTGAQEIKRT
jgi:dUTP pyrophosphatase